MTKIFAYKELAHTVFYPVVGMNFIVIKKVVFNAIIFVDEDAWSSLDLTQANLVFLQRMTVY